MKEFEKAAIQNKIEEMGWPLYVYGVSKIGINLYAKILSKY